jgi:hypothetical protein
MARKTLMIETLVLLLFSAITGCGGNDMPQFQGGDIIFQESRSSQSEALRLAMHSPLTHVGVIFIDGDEPVVYEAVGPVKYTPLEEWIRHGVDEHFVVKRLFYAARFLDEEGIARLRYAGERYAGRPYDFHFVWSDDRIYCSELVWKMYESAFGIRIGELQKFGDFDLSDPAVVSIIKERFPDGIPEDEVVISPRGIFNSKLLTTVYEH